MKPSIFATIAILGIAALLGQRHHQRITSARQDLGRLTAEAMALGLDPATLTATAADGAAPSSRQRAPRQQSTDREAKARDFAKRLSAFVLEMQQREKDGLPQDPSFQETLFNSLDEMLHLDKEQLKVVIAAIRNDTALDDEMRSNIIGFAVMTMATDHPASALATFTESAGLLGNGGGHVLHTAISRMAQTDPAAALAWLRNHEANHPEMDTNAAKQGLIEGTAKRDPAEAFRMISELGETRNTASARATAIASAATDPASRTAVLHALREHLKTQPPGQEANEMRSATITTLARQAIGEGFESATEWVESSGLNPMETDVFIAGLDARLTSNDAGQWIDWIGGHLPPEKLSEKIEPIFNQWTHRDYRAAGEWLLKAPEGPAKAASVKVYAATLAPHHPESAAQWALTLPAGPERTEILSSIHRTLTRTDPDAAANFAIEHSLDR